MKQGCQLFPASCQYSAQSTSGEIRQEKEFKMTWIGKEKDKLFLFASNVIVYVSIYKRCQNFYQKTSKIQQNFNKMAEYKINLQKPVASLIPRKKHAENIMGTLLFTIDSKKIKYLRTHLTTEMSVL